MVGSLGQQALAAARLLDLEHQDFTVDELADEDPGHYAHAPGQICARCHRPIEADQPARKRGESGWVHDLCPG
jgi:mono/diheme cytochrome c family protein